MSPRSLEQRDLRLVPYHVRVFKPQPSVNQYFYMSHIRIQLKA
jgi:hypothetical protein